MSHYTVSDSKFPFILHIGGKGVDFFISFSFTQFYYPLLYVMDKVFSYLMILENGCKCEWDIILPDLNEAKRYAEIIARKTKNRRFIKFHEVGNKGNYYCYGKK